MLRGQRKIVHLFGGDNCGTRRCGVDGVELLVPGMMEILIRCTAPLDFVTRSRNPWLFLELHHPKHGEVNRNLAAFLMLLAEAAT